MSRMTVEVLLFAVLSMQITTAAFAQEFGVVTSVYDEGAADWGLRIKNKKKRNRGTHGSGSSEFHDPKLARTRICSHSVTLFHAGKVYDYIDEIGEVTIFEPAHSRFTLLDTNRKMATTVEFDEIKHLLKIARRETEEHVVRLEKNGSPNSLKVAGPLRFQLNPRFNEHFDATKKQLTLSSRYLRYQARCAEVNSPEIVDVYLRYADWICKLNYVLHPHLLLPEPRLALNASLLRKRLIPVEVDLRAEFENPLHLRAEHRFHWELNRTDRSVITRFETMLKKKTTRRLTFQEYQRVLWTRTADKKR